jgi:hypothetical protein
MSEDSVPRGKTFTLIVVSGNGDPAAANGAVFSALETAGTYLVRGEKGENMDEHRCKNCGGDAADTYELLIRSRNHQEVPLCEECHEAIRAELAE